MNVNRDMEVVVIIILTVAHNRRGIKPEATSCDTASETTSGERAYELNGLVFKILKFSGWTPAIYYQAAKTKYKISEFYE